MTNRELVEIIGASPEAYEDAFKAFKFQVEDATRDDYHDWLVWLLENE